MKVTVCQFSSEPDALAADWQKLVAHVRSEKSDFVLLPEMPFFPWMAYSKNFVASVWEAAVAEHAAWHRRFSELGGIVAGTQPVTRQGRRLNEAFLWYPDTGYHAIHAKYYLPDEEAFWEATWYERGDLQFVPAKMNSATVAAMICTEMWFTEHARAFARAGVDLLLSPRATAMGSVDKWIAGGRAAAVMSGAFCLSSNRGGTDGNGLEWAGNGWIIDPEEGDILALTSVQEPFMTLDIDLDVARHAKQTYPRYVKE